MESELVEALKTRALLLEIVNKAHRSREFLKAHTDAQTGIFKSALDSNEREKVLLEVEELIRNIQSSGLSSEREKTRLEVLRAQPVKEQNLADGRRLRDRLEEKLQWAEIAERQKDIREGIVDLGPVETGARRFGVDPKRDVKIVAGEIIDTASNKPVVGFNPGFVPPPNVVKQNKSSLYDQAVSLGLTGVTRKASRVPDLQKFISENLSKTPSAFSKGSSSGAFTGLFDTITFDPTPEPKDTKGKKQAGSGLHSTQRLQVLLGSIAAGNKSKAINDKAMVMMDDLLINKKITKKQHKQMFDKFIK